MPTVSVTSTPAPTPAPPAKSSAAVHPKVVSATAGAAIGGIISGALSLFHINIAPEWSSVISSVLALGLGYLTPSE